MRKNFRKNVIAGILTMSLAGNMMPVMVAHAQENVTIESVVTEDETAELNTDDTNIELNTDDANIEFTTESAMTDIEEQTTASIDETDSVEETVTQTVKNLPENLYEGNTEQQLTAKRTEQVFAGTGTVKTEGSLITYSGYSQTYGEQPAVSDGAVMGIKGQSKRLESFQIEKGTALKDVEGDIVYRARIESRGKTNWVKNGTLIGNAGQTRNIEAIQIYLTGELAEKYDVYYTVHAQTYGWMKWTKGAKDNQSWCGTAGLSKRIEAIQVKLVEKNREKAPSNSAESSYIATEVLYSGHSQTYGNQKAVSDGAALGVTGQSKRLEAIKIEKGPALEDIQGDIVYRAHVQSYGNMNWVKNGAMMGTTGQAKRIEAVQIYLTGDLAKKYDIYYNVYAQTYGWMKWTKGSSNDSSWCGTAGISKRIEAIQIKLVEKQNGKAPTINNGAYSYITATNMGGVSYSGHQQKVGNLNTVSNGSVLGQTGSGKRLEAVRISLNHDKYGVITYRTYVDGYGWMNWSQDGQLSGTTGQGRRLEAIEINLNGEIAKYYDVWYRAHIQSYGWLGWAKNGQSAGSVGMGKRMEALQIQVVPKTAFAPGSNSGYFITMTPQDLRVQRAVQNVYNQVGANLYSCYNWCVNNIRYSRLGYHVPAGYTNSQWYALYGLENGYGDCRTYAAAFYQLAKGMGYNCHYVYGYVPSRSGGMIDHAWTEVNIGGTNYVFDPDFQHETRRNGYQIYYGMSGTWRYMNYEYQS